MRLKSLEPTRKCRRRHDYIIIQANRCLKPAKFIHSRILQDNLNESAEKMIENEIVHVFSLVIHVFVQRANGSNKMNNRRLEYCLKRLKDAENRV